MLIKNKKIKFLIASIALAMLFFSSCEKEMYGEATRKQIDRNDFIINRKSFDQLNKETKFNSAYKRIDSEIQNRKLSSKTVMEEMYNFSIDFSQINEVSTDKYTSYSFAIIRDSINPNFYENLFIEIDSTDSPQASILKYNINPNTKEITSISAKLIQYSISQTGKILYTPPCSSVTVATESPCDCAGHFSGESCSCTQGPTSSIQTYLICQDSGGGGSDPIDNTSTTSGGGGTGGTSIAAPRELTPKEQRIKNFKLQLTPEQKDCINSLNETKQGELMNFLESDMEIDGLISSETSYSGEDIQFAEEAIENLCNGGEVDFDLQVILDPSFINSPKIKCLYDKLINSPSNNLFKDMLQLFSNSTNKNLKFSVGNVVGDFGITNGNINTPNDYNIIIDNSLENYSNLAVITTLCHELIHAFMFDSLEDVGYISFDINGQPYITASITCPAYVGVNINTLTIDQKFEILICALNSAGNLNTQWTHELFNSNVFSSQAFRVSLANFLKINHDWNNETPIFKNQCINTFGISNWINETATTASWIGLDYTADFNSYLNSYTSSQQSFIQNFTTNLISSKPNCP